MKVKKVSIPTQSKISDYLPANYTDAFYCEFTSGRTITPAELLHAFWTIQPGWINALFQLRNWMVRPFGLKSGERIAQDSPSDHPDLSYDPNLSKILHTSKNEIVMGLEDKHLTAYISFYIDKTEGIKQTVTLTTVVHFHYWLGYLYFYTIAPFHTLIVRNGLKYILRKLSCY